MNQATETEIQNWKSSPQVRRKVMELSEVRLLPQLKALAFDWGIILGLALFNSYFSNIYLYLVSAFIIGCRQHALVSIMHEGAHYRISKNVKINDAIANWLAAYPIFMSLAWYRDSHNAHHRYLNTDNDPDWVRKKDLKVWQYPQTISYLVFRNFGQQILFGVFEWLSVMIPLSVKRWQHCCYLAIVAALLTVTNLWTEFALYWVIPYALVFPVVQRIRSAAEHFGLARDHDLNDTRDVVSGPLERFVCGPHNINYHLAHHLFPSVPQYNLKKLHRFLMSTEVYAQHSRQNQSYFFPLKGSVMADLLSQPSKKDASLKESA